MLNILQNIFSVNNFEPHSVHFFPDHLGLMWFIIITNAVIAIAYIALPIELSYIYFKRRDFAFSWVFIVVAFFGIWCSMTHIMKVVVFWYPAYYLEGVINAITGIVSFGAFIAFIPATYLALKLTSPAELENSNKKLADEIKKHKENKEKLELVNKNLEDINKEIETKNKELERLNNLMVDREIDIINTKKEMREPEKS